MEETQTTSGDQPAGNHQPLETMVVESTAYEVNGHTADEASPSTTSPADEQSSGEKFWNREEGGLSDEFVSPFQASDPLPAVNASTAQAAGSPPGKTQPAPRRFPAMNVAVVGIIVFVVGGLFLMWVSAKPASPLQRSTAATAASTVTAPRGRPTHKQAATPSPTPMATTERIPQIPSDQTLGQLGWTAAGLTTADALQAERTAATFTEREETLVFNEAGTRTAAVFLLTAGGRERFTQFDVRAASDVFWNSVTDPQRQLIQFALNLQPTLVKFAAQGQQQFAWVDVAFWRWQSRIDPNDPKHLRRISGMELDPANGAPRVHHMFVLLLRVAPVSQGTGAPMGGAGWLVSTYALDPAVGTLPDIPSPA